ncbi:alpha/beta fold hydrolase [Pseudomonas sp. gcc21]|uniref:alpha/beta fold hydrolase n=1 Tax=Pseudomonas sp. gcc21 TaxID=2726989 RepID=UPI0014523438|nr:alpha/beta fold hydrolase [Pseudomonas sp. gcc21]QJD60446.1 alpha/beta fold hydrolase [Pseudomonas sp. gcc21]
MTNISLLPGWAMSAASMEPLRSALLERLPRSQVQCCDLPALQMSSIETDLAELGEQLPKGVLIGWSLGGVVALQLSRRFPEKFRAVVTIASNPCFVTRRDWAEAMPADTFKTFYADYRDEPDKTLKRFALLVTQGSNQPKALSRSMQWDDADHEQRLHALAILGVLDSRAILRRSVLPTLHCLGAQDALVPAAVEAALKELNDYSHVAVHPGAGHALPLEQPLWLAEQIAEFLQAGDD